MEPVPGVRSLQGDFLSSKVQEELRRVVLQEVPRGFGLGRGPDLAGEEGTSSKEEGIVDVVLSDMMAPMSGVRIRDIAASLSLVEAASAFAFKVLKSARGDEAWMKKGKERFPGGHML
jgi:23S rRNA (uridine2552-2'-O)-methyltransferase